MPKVGVACGFHHRPDEDGLLIPASSYNEIEDHELNRVLPILGYMVFFQDGWKRPFWKFMEYRASVCYTEAERKGGSGKDLPARYSTTSVVNLECRSCQAAGPYPGWGGVSKGQCPFCGHRGSISTEPIKEGSDQFFRMVGDLRQPLEDAARHAAAGDEGFQFPQLLLGGTNLAPSANVRPDLQGKAQERGMAFVPMDEVDHTMLVNTENGSLSIVPDITSGVLDEDEVRAGKAWGAGSLACFIKANLPSAPRQVTFKNIRF